MDGELGFLLMAESSSWERESYSQCRAWFSISGVTFVLVAVLILDDDAIDLLAKIGDVRFDDGRVPAPIVLPHVIENLRLGQHAAFIVHEVAKKLVFGGAQVDWLSGSGTRRASPR